MDQHECKHCGLQNISKFRPESRPGGRIYYRCILCDKNRKQEYNSSHSAENTEKHKQWCAAHRESAREISNRAHRKCRLEAIQAYSDSMSCAICNESHIEFLAIDHIDGGGNFHRKSAKIKNINYWLKAHKYPSGFRVLCHNCNFKHGRKQTVLNEISHRINQKIKEWIFNAYGRSCVCCGADDLDILSIDHINGGGTKHRKQVGVGKSFYQWLINNDFPIGFRTLCLNCNIAMGVLGQCPHHHV